MEPHPWQGLEAALAEGRDVVSFLQQQKGFPIAFTEARYTANADDDPEGLDHNLERILLRVVRPQRRGGPSSLAPAQIFERRLRPLIRRRLIERNHFFESSRSGLPRSVEFFANHSANLALDTLRLAVVRADEVIHRADAEAGKIYDIRGTNPDVQFLVYCELAHDSDALQTNENARRVLESAGATLLTSIDETAEKIASVVS